MKSITDYLYLEWLAAGHATRDVRWHHRVLSALAAGAAAWLAA